MEARKIVAREAWIAARKDLLASEKELTRHRDEVSRRRRELPWTRVEKAYVFDGARGRRSLAELFDGRGQLIVVHFMFAPDWGAGCKSCSFWADQYDGIIPHLHQRDTSFVVVSRAPLDKLLAFRRRMGWGFEWVSSAGGDFNFDYGVSFAPDVPASYNYAPKTGEMSELPGISVFSRSPDGEVFHTYSCYARGLDMMNAAYQFLDLTPKGRDEAGLPFTMAWVRLHDEYGR